MYKTYLYNSTCIYSHVCIVFFIYTWTWFLKNICFTYKCLVSCKDNYLHLKTCLNVFVCCLHGSCFFYMQIEILYCIFWHIFFLKYFVLVSICLFFKMLCICIFLFYMKHDIYISSRKWICKKDTHTFHFTWMILNVF